MPWQQGRRVVLLQMDVCLLLTTYQLSVEMFLCCRLLSVLIITVTKPDEGHYTQGDGENHSLCFTVEHLLAVYTTSLIVGNRRFFGSGGNSGIRDAERRAP
jgi:hypothetical protein